MKNLINNEPVTFKYYERDYSWQEGAIYEQVDRKEALRLLKNNHWIEVVYEKHETFGLNLHEPHVKWDGTKLIADAHYRGGSPFGEIEDEDLPF